MATVGFNKPVSKLQPFADTIPGAPSTKTYHGLTISMDNEVIGRIQNWAPNAYSRNAEHVYELNVQSFGRPVDVVPGIATGFQIGMGRVEIWAEELEVAIGYTPSGTIWDDLTDQTRPFTIDEYLYRGTSLYQHIQYVGCWFMEKNQGAAEAQGNGIYQVDCTIIYIQRVVIP